MGCPKHLLKQHDTGLSLLEHHIARASQHPFRRRYLAGVDSEKLPPDWQSLADSLEFAGQGPLAGLAAALTLSETGWVAVLAVDYPNFPLHQFFRAAVEHPNPDWIVFSDREGREQWLCSLMKPKLAGLVTGALREGRRSVHGLRNHTRCLVLGLGENEAPGAFLNLNTPHDLKEWVRP